MTICGAKTRSGEPCKSHAVTGRTRCRMHGGAIPRGHALPQTTTGRYSKDMPTRIAARVMEAETDPDLLSLRTEIAITDARIGELFAELGTADPKTALFIWARIEGRIEQRRKLVESEQRRLVAMQQMITAEQAGVWVSAMISAVKRHVHDDDTIAAIAREFERLTA